MSLNSDGTFVCKVQTLGFIANTLSQRVSGTVRGTWKITGSTIILKLTGEKNENFENKVASSSIVAFRKNELVLKSELGETSTFQRVPNH